jgi:hypothetical protein
LSNPKQKKNVRSDFNKARLALADVMREHLAFISGDLISQVMNYYDRAIPSQQINAPKHANIHGVMAYKEALRDAMSVVSLDAMEKARKEVPSKKKIRLAEWSDDSLHLAEFDRLPKSVQKRILNQSSLIIEAQTADLQKAIYFQFGSSLDSTDSFSILQGDLEESAEDYIQGAAVSAGSGTEAAALINNARNAFFFTDEVLEEIEAFEFVNGDPVSPICEDLAGTVFPKDDPEAARYYPPLHHNCKSFLVPILVGNLGNKEVGKLRPSSERLEKYIGLSEV